MLPTPPSLDSLLADGRIALFLDFDGTLVEIAANPEAISPAAGLADGLRTLSQRLAGACAIVSGRALDDIARHLGGALPIAAAGSHGADLRDANGAALGKEPLGLPPAIEMAMREFAEQNGLGFERKPHGAALHYREQPEAGEMVREFAETLAIRYGWRVQSGKCVVELVEGQADKGSAVRALMETGAFAGARPIFIGDDLTDEAGFRACLQMGGMGVLVGKREPSAAQHGLRDVAAVHHWLGLKG